jgi:Leucine-rich repeat (LRR) protein
MSFQNFIGGTIPSELSRFDDMRLLASNNVITDVPPSICEKSTWMDGLLASGCDALLCPKGTFSEAGRRTSSSSCEPCDHRGAAIYLGTTRCGPLAPVTSERSVLEEFFDSAKGPLWKDQTGWKSSAPVCQWFGITCTKNSAGEDSVSEISLPSNGLSGRVGSIIFHLPNLRILDVSGNLVAMTFRDAFKARNLEEVNVSHTGVSSVEGIGGARSLRKLMLSGNIFTGQDLPDEIYSLTKLTHLSVARSGFLGTISEQVSQLSSLLYLDLSYNELGGSIPPSLGSLAKLTSLNLSENHLYGEIPSSLGGLSSLESLYLSGRTRAAVGFSGTLPAFSALRKLRHIDLGGNSLTGTVPPNLLAGLDSFNEQVNVFIDSNMIHGVIPLSLNRFSRLSIDLADNEIEGIPPGLCEMTLWWDGDVASHDCNAILCPPGTFNDIGRQDSPDNRCEDCPGAQGEQFYGRTVCPSLQKAKSKKILEDLYSATGGANWKRRENWLTHPDICVWHGITCKNGVEIETVNLGSNNLSGTPPKELFELFGLKNLWLFSNPITFTFDGIENAETLVNLQLDSVGLRSLDGIGSAPSLTYLDVRFNALEGTIPSDIEMLTNLETLLISDNNLYGPLPSFTTNRRLTTLKAGGNGFNGPLPSFSVHPNLRRIDVIGNQLNGQIPNDLLAEVDSSKPVLLYLSMNKFSGILPSSLARFDDLTILVSDNEITGISAELCEQDRWNGGDVERFGCDAILCPPRSYAPARGRASSDSGDCVACSSANFFGHSICVSSGGVKRATYGTFAALAISTALGLLL